MGHAKSYVVAYIELGIKKRDCHSMSPGCPAEIEIQTSDLILDRKGRE